MTRRPLSEFALIDTYFKPLAKGHSASLDLGDDAALLTVDNDQELVISQDMLVAGIHFMADETPENVASKALRVNLSDLAAMAAEPVGYLLSAAWPHDLSQDWIAAFCTRLHKEQKLFSLALLGGDTVRTPGPLSLSISILGRAPKHQALRRSGAKAGDLIMVSGTIGDAGVGLEILKGTLGGPPASPESSNFLLQRFHQPQPRLALAKAMRHLAHACIDISDGLLADIQHICQQSNVGAEIQLGDIPISAAAKRLYGDNREQRLILASFGDDYELVFAVQPDNLQQATDIALANQSSLTAIGQFTSANEFLLFDDNKAPVRPPKLGWQHF